MAGRAPRTLSLPNPPPLPKPPQTTQPPSPKEPREVPRLRARFLIIEARFHEAIADELVAGAIAELEAHGATYDRVAVPGALEIPQVLAAAVSAGLIPQSAPGSLYAGAIALGCVIRGDTYHFEIVANNANHWLMEFATRHGVPVGNGILTVDTTEQALERAKRGRDGKGGDAARACIALLTLTRQFQAQGA